VSSEIAPFSAGEAPADVASSAAAAAQSVAANPHRAAAGHGAFDFWKAAHRALRGRHRIAFLLACAGMALGAWLGGMFGQRLYSASGLVRIASVLPSVMKETDQNRPIAMFDGFLQAQRDMMMSREMIREALEDPAWQQSGVSRRIPTEEIFAAGLKVETRQRSDHLRVTYTGKDPAVAALAVKTIIGAYSAWFTNEQNASEQQREQVLRKRVAALNEELKTVEKEMQELAGGRTAAELDALAMAAAERGKKLRAALADVQTMLAGGPNLLPVQGNVERSPAEMVAGDLLRTYSVEQAKTETQLEQARIQGYLPSHPIIQRLEATAKLYRDRVAKYTADYDRLRARRGDQVSDLTVEERESKLQELADAAGEELRSLAGVRSRVALLEQRAEVLHENVSATEARLDAILTEASTAGRLSIVSGGEKPITAAIDSRPKTTAIGLVLGMLFPLGCIILLDSIRHRYRYAEDVAHDLQGRTSFVAVLPDINAQSSLAAASARCVHALRVRLQPQAPGQKRIYAVTSTGDGDGKSTLALSLALSFAAAGYRTLLVDGDIGPNHLSGGVGAGEQPGMIEAAEGAEPHVLPMPTKLHFLASGKGSAHHAFRLSPAAIGRMLDKLRGEYDVIIIDSDPIVRGFTASLFAGQVDGMILAVSRGQLRSALLAASRQVTSLGGRLAAVVLNHAHPSDVAGKAESSYPKFARGTPLPERLQRFGPLVAAMLTSLSFSREQDLDVVISERTNTFRIGERREEAA
jgi:succinoglycan biosynthesis transport protein ExoP